MGTKQAASYRYSGKANGLSYLDVFDVAYVALNVAATGAPLASVVHDVPAAVEPPPQFVAVPGE